MGFLFYFFQDESITFKALVQMFEKYEMTELFSQDFTVLKKYFFQLDKLSFIYYPLLTEYLKNEGIESYLYSSTWFITLFSNVMSYTKKSIPPCTILAIWDSFLLNGWKSIFKAGLFILSEFHDKLLNLKFEEIMMTLGNLPGHEIFYSHDSAAKLREKLKNKNITRRMLETIGQEYDSIMSEVKEYKVNNENI